MFPTIVASLLIGAQQGVGLIAPADPSLRARCAPAAVDTFELTIVTPGQPDRAVATVHRTRALSQENGIPVCVVTNHSERLGSSDLDSSIVDASTLAPVRYAAQVGVERQWFRFTADSAIGMVQRGDSAPQRVAQSAPRPFFLAVPDLEVVRALPLMVGYEVQFTAYNPPRGFHVTRIRVEALDTIRISGRREAAWRLTYDAGAAPTVMWLGRANHELLRSRSTLQNGAVFWRRRADDHDS